MAHFTEFLKSEEGQRFTSGLNSGDTITGSLQENLTALYVSAADEVSDQTIEPTYDPLLAKVLKFVTNGAHVMKAFGVAERDVPGFKQHEIIKEATTDDVLLALEIERRYHDTMHDKGRETIKYKSASEQALTMIGLFGRSAKVLTTGDESLALKYLKDAVATGVRALEEAQLPGSIAEVSRKHYQEKLAQN